MSKEPKLNLRDWFAGLAMQGLLASDSEFGMSVEDVSSNAYEQADAMLKEREKINE